MALPVNADGDGDGNVDGSGASGSAGDDRRGGCRRDDSAGTSPELSRAPALTNCAKADNARRIEKSKSNGIRVLVTIPSDRDGAPGYSVVKGWDGGEAAAALVVLQTTCSCKHGMTGNLALPRQVKTEKDKFPPC